LFGLNRHGLLLSTETQIGVHAMFANFTEDKDFSVVGAGSFFLVHGLWMLFAVLIKLTILGCILIGSVKAITHGLGSPSGLFANGTWEGLSRIINALIEHWLYVLLLVVFLWIRQMKTRISTIAEDIKQIKMSAVALGNYVEIEVETEALRSVRKDGPWALWKNNLPLNIWQMIFGESPAHCDALTAKAVRNQEVVSLRSDLGQ